MPHPQARRLFPPLIAGLLAVACLGGLQACRGPRPQASAPATSEVGDRPLTAGELREMLARGTIRPVTSLQDEDPFRPFEGTMDDRQGGQRVPPAPSALPEKSVAPAAVAENPYVTFGERIRVHQGGTITKPYPLRVGTGKNLLDLLQKYARLPLWSADKAGGLPSGEYVQLELLEGWDLELVQDLRNPADPAKEQRLADWLVVTTSAALLQEVEDFINLFAAGVPQIEIEAKIVEITLSDSLDLGVRPPEGKPLLDFPDHTFIKSFDGSFPNQSEGAEGLLTLGGVQDGVAFNAILEALATRDNVSIISRPKIAVREGGRADISNTVKIPFLQLGNIQATGGYQASVAYQEVGVKLFVVPRVVGTRTVALNIDIEASQQSGSETVLVTDDGDTVVNVPVLSQRSARTTVYLQPGQAVILGGLITERNVDGERKVPLLGDLPLLKFAFRSKFTRKEETNVLFFIRPRILQGIDLHREF
jgi:type II secretory pathway component GspD/PulD (secretin)